MSVELTKTKQRKTTECLGMFKRTLILYVCITEQNQIAKTSECLSMFKRTLIVYVCRTE